MGQGAVMIQNIHGFGNLSIRSDLNGGMPNDAGSAPATAITEPQDRVTLSKEAQNASNNTGEPTQASAPNSSEPTSAPAKFEAPDRPGGYGPQWAQRPQPWQSTGRQINLQA